MFSKSAKGDDLHQYTYCVSLSNWVLNFQKALPLVHCTPSSNSICTRLWLDSIPGMILHFGCSFDIKNISILDCIMPGLPLLHQVYFFYQDIKIYKYRVN